MKKLLRVVRDIPQHWVGNGFPVRSMFSYSQNNNAFDPFLLLDYVGPHEFAPSTENRGVGEHPHRGFETVTIVYQGELEHRDSSGAHGAIGAGDVQWMTAASGVVHEEFHSARFAQQGGVLEMVQLWVNLPAESKLAPPRYQAIEDSQVPAVELQDRAGTVRVIAGAYGGTSGPAKTFTPITVLDVQLKSDRSVALHVPVDYTTLLVVQQGAVAIDGSNETAKAGELAQFAREGESIGIRAMEDSQVLLLAGQPIGEPVVGYGPFVMNTREQIQDAIADYKAGRMGRLS